MPGLGTSFGRGGATTFLQDLQNADCILIEGSNMAEAHPVGFQWVMEAKRRGATVIHVDPRFTRTSAVADLHVPIRAGSDIAFLGGLVNHVLSNDLDFREYVVAYTNAANLIDERLRRHRGPRRPVLRIRPGDRPLRPDHVAIPAARGHGRGRAAARGGVEGDEAAGADQRASHQAARSESHGSGGAPVSWKGRRDETLQDPRCVFQILKRHFARYTPEMVQEVCGIEPEQFRQVADALTSNSGRERTAAFCYAVGWTHHSVGAQMIRTAAILQTLLGNIGRPGGGIMALRGHASIQGSTDIPTLFNILPGYLPMPQASQHQSLDEWVVDDEGKTGFWGNMRSYAVSLLKSYWGDAATADNDFCFDYLPRITGDHSTYNTVKAQIEGRCKGYFLVGENPAVGSANGKMQRLGMANLDWLVVRDLQMIESATFWKDGPEIETGELVTEEIGTEIFFLPAATHVEKAGSFTQTQRMLQWRDKAVDPPGDARSDLDFYYELGHRIRERLAGSTDDEDRPAARPRLGLPGRRARGGGRPGGAAGDQRHRPRRGGAVGVHRAEARRLDRVRLLDLLRRLRRRGQPGPAAQAALGAGRGRRRVGLGVAGEPAHPLQPSLRRTRRHARGASARSTSGGTRSRTSGSGRDVPDFMPDRAPDHVPEGGREGSRRDRRPGPVHHADRRQGLALRPARSGRRTDADPLRAAGVAGPQPAATPSRTTPRAAGSTIRDNPINPSF